MGLDLASAAAMAEICLQRVRAGHAGELDAAALFALQHAQAAAAAGAVDELPELLRTAAQAAAALFAVARSGGAAIDAPLGSPEAIRLAGAVDRSTTHGGRWLDGFWSALAVRDLQSLFLLAATPVELLRASPSRGDEHVYLTAAALRAYVTGDPASEERFVDALEATDPARATVAGADFALDIRALELELAFRLLDRDEPAFDASLRKALTLHERYWSAPERRDEPDGELALGPLALAAEAFDAGLRITVDSPYLPATVVALGPPAQVVCCPACVTPIADGTVTCPACLFDVTRDAPIELGGAQLRALPRRSCGHCGFRVPELAVRCPACRSAP